MIKQIKWTTIATTCVLIVGCSGGATRPDGSTEPSIFETIARIGGSALGAAAGNKLGTQMGLDSTGKTMLTVAGAGIGAVIGGKIAKYLTERDKQNISNVLNDTKNNQPVAWCSDSQSISRNVGSVQCSKANKITATPGVTTKNDQGKICRSLKTEHEAHPDETGTQTVCQAEDGRWYEKTA